MWQHTFDIKKKKELRVIARAREEPDLSTKKFTEERDRYISFTFSRQSILPATYPDQRGVTLHLSAFLRSARAATLSRTFEDIRALFSENTILLRERSREPEHTARDTADRKNKDASCMIYRRYTAIRPQVSPLRAPLIFLIHSSSPRRHLLPLSACNLLSASQSLFFSHQRLLLQLLLPTFEVTSRPFRPSVTSAACRTGGSKSGGHFC